MKLGRNKAGSNDDVLEGISQMYQPAQQGRETVKQPHGETVSEEEEAPAEDQVVKTSFYPKPAQLDKLDDLAAEYNRRYRRKRPRINRNHIIRFLIDLVDMDMLDELNSKP